MVRIALSSRNGLFIKVACLLALVALLGFASKKHTHSSPDSQPPKLVTLDQAWGVFQHPDTVFIDARSPKSFNRRHIEGALSLPIMHFDSVYPKLVDKLSGKTLVLYCGGPSCTKSDHLAPLLFKKGHSRVLVMKSGISSWVGRGLPVE